MRRLHALWTGIRAAITSWRARLPADLKPADFTLRATAYFSVTDDGEVWIENGFGWWIGPDGQMIRSISGGEGELDLGGGLGNLVGQAADFLGGSADKAFAVPGLPSFSAGDLSLGNLAPSGEDTGGGGLWGWLTNAASKITPGDIIKGGISLGQIPLLIRGMQDSANARKTLQQSVKTAQETAAPAAAGAAALIPAATTAELGGALPPNIEADIAAKVNTYRQQQLNALVAQGMDPQTARAQVEAAVGEYEQQLRTQWTNQLLAGGTSLTEASLGGNRQASLIAGADQQNLNQSLDAATQAAYRLLGAS